MLTQDEATTRVARGAAHLDQVRPGWFTRIDVGTLTLHSGCRCILGQLHDWDALGYNDSGSTLAEDHGFYVPLAAGDGTLGRTYAPLQDAWIAAIADRVLASARDSAQPVPVGAVARVDHDQHEPTPRDTSSSVSDRLKATRV